MRHKFQSWFCFPAAVAQASIREEKKLMVENAKLKSDIEQLRNQLLEKERKRGGLFHSSFFFFVEFDRLRIKPLRSEISTSTHRSCLCEPAAGTFDVSCCSLEHYLVFTNCDNISGISAAALWSPILGSRFSLRLRPYFSACGDNVSVGGSVRPRTLTFEWLRLLWSPNDFQI